MPVPEQRLHGYPGAALPRVRARAARGRKAPPRKSAERRAIGGELAPTGLAAGAAVGETVPRMGRRREMFRRTADRPPSPRAARRRGPAVPPAVEAAAPTAPASS